MSDAMVNRSDVSVGGGVVKGTDYTKPTKEKVVPTKFIFVGIGQCGASLALATKRKMGSTAKVVAINSSYRDLDAIGNEIPEEFKIKYGTTDGTGKDRTLSQTMFRNHLATSEKGEKLDIISHFLYNYSEFLFSTTDNVTIIVMFSSAGGSGSGAGPYFTTKLSQTIQQMDSVVLRGKTIPLNDANRPDVVGICVTPSYINGSEGIKSLQNTIECGSEIQKFVSGRLASFFIVSNEISTEKQLTKTETLNYVNDRVSDALVRFFGVYGRSQYKCIDSQDKRSAIRTPGVHSLVTFDQNEEPVGYQFMLPKRQRVRQLVAELPESYSNETGAAERVMEKILNKMDIMTDDQNIGYYGGMSEHVDSKIIDTDFVSRPIIGLFGCTEINSLFEPFKQKLEHLMKASEEKSDMMFSSGHGFDRVKETKEQVRNEYAKRTVNLDDIDSMLD